MIRRLSTEHGQSRPLKRLWLANAVLCLLLAQSRHPDRVGEGPLWGVKQTSKFKSVTSASDPKRTLSHIYSTMFALNTNDEGMLRPSAFAVFEFTVNSNSVGS